MRVCMCAQDHTTQSRAQMFRFRSSQTQYIHLNENRFRSLTGNIFRLRLLHIFGFEEARARGKMHVWSGLPERCTMRNVFGELCACCALFQVTVAGNTNAASRFVALYLRASQTQWRGLREFSARRGARWRCDFVGVTTSLSGLWWIANANVQIQPMQGCFVYVNARL